MTDYNYVVWVWIKPSIHGWPSCDFKLIPPIINLSQARVVFLIWV